MNDTSTIKQILENFELRFMMISIHQKEISLMLRLHFLVYRSIIFLQLLIS